MDQRATTGRHDGGDPPAMEGPRVVEKPQPATQATEATATGRSSGWIAWLIFLVVVAAGSAYLWQRPQASAPVERGGRRMMQPSSIGVATVATGDMTVSLDALGAVAELAAAAGEGTALINAGDGRSAHPTQGLLDMLTLRQAKGRIALLAAVAEVGGAWTTAQSTAALSDLADAALDASLDFLMRKAADKGDPVPGADASAAGSRLARLRRLHRHEAEELDAPAHLRLGGRGDLPAHELAGLGQGPVGEIRHGRQRTVVTRSTSAAEVSPARHLATPSSSMVVMPAAMAARSTADAPA